MNHLISLHTLSELLIRSLIFTWSVHESVIWCLTLVKQKQCVIICAAVSLTHSHWQTKNSTSDTHIWFKNAASSILFILIWMIIVLSVLWRAAYYLIAACSDSLISSSSHSDFSASHHCFHLLSSILSADRLFWCSFFNHVSAHWILTSSLICINCCCWWQLLHHSLLYIFRHAFLIRFFMSDFLYLSWNWVSLTFRYRSSREVNISVSSTEIEIAW